MAKESESESESASEDSDFDARFEIDEEAKRQFKFTWGRWDWLRTGSSTTMTVRFVPFIITFLICGLMIFLPQKMVTNKTVSLRPELQPIQWPDWYK